jgi:hypothetical protein
MRLLYETIKEIIDTECIGVPVFVRCAVQMESDGEYVEEILARTLSMACSWLEAFPFQIYAQTGNGSGQVTVTTHHTGGQTSIVSVNTAPGAKDGIDLILLGNKGAVYQDAETIPPGFDVTAEPLPVPEWLRDAVERSLSAGRPVFVEEVADNG